MNDQFVKVNGHMTKTVAQYLVLRYEKTVFLNKGYLQENEMWIGTSGTIRFAPVDDPENYFQWTPTMTVDL